MPQNSPSSAPILLEPTNTILRVENLTKRFPLVTAVECVSFDVCKGEIHCLLGENGAGKTTLAECAYGYLRPNSGSIFFKDARIENPSPKDSIKLGIGMVHQHFVLIDTLSVIENVVLGMEGPGLSLHLSQAETRLITLCEEYGVDLNIHAKIWELPVGQQQWVEILKALYIGADLLIFDEPTAVLTPQESENLFRVLRKMKDAGLSIILITHKLREVMAVSDRVTVLRKGKRVCTVETRNISMAELAQLMVGREVSFKFEKDDMAFGKSILSVKNLTAVNDFGRQVVNNVSFELRSHEILGVAGVSGNGQKELSEVLIGVRKMQTGQVLIGDRLVEHPTVDRLMDRGIGHIPQDRNLGRSDCRIFNCS